MRLVTIPPSHSALVATFFLVAAFAAQAQTTRITDPVLAVKLGLTVQQIHSLEDALGWTDADLLTVLPTQLQTLAFDLDHPGLDKHMEALKFRALRMMDEHGNVPPDGLMHAIDQRNHVGQDADLFPVPPGNPGPGTNIGSPGPLTAGIATNTWTWLGPGNIGGRVRSILVHPTLTNIFWCGGVDGGVWKSTNSGASWFPLNDFMPNLAVSCLAMDPQKPDVIYAGTGEGMYNLDAVPGAGIFRTSDGGNTWAQVSTFQYVNRIAIDPNNDQVILAATRTGVFRTSDGGATWSLRTATEMLDIAFHPTNSSLAICSGWNGKAFYSNDGGQTWTAATGLPAPSGFVKGRVEAAYSASNPSTVCASMDNNSGEIYVSMDGGHTYALRNTGNSFLGSQGWYGNALWCDPTTTNVLVVGGIDLWRSTDGGATLTHISQWQSAPTSSAHADHHAIVASPAFDGVNVRTVYFGNDGGVYRANDIYTASLTSGWHALNNNLGITQFYGGAGNSNTSVTIGGCQDNGTERYTTGGGPNGWSSMFGGDGGYCAADQGNSSYFYGEYVYLQIHRSSNGGSSSSYIYTGITDAGSGSTANFIAPFILDPNNANTMLAGGMSLWRSTNVKAGTPSWTAIKPSVSSAINAIAVAPGNSSVIWVGHNSGAVYYTTNGTAASPTWFARNSGLPARTCQRIAINPTNSSKVYATFGGFNSGNVWRSTNSGVNWVNITANLPSAPVNSIVIAPSDPNTLYVGTEVGIFGSSNDGGTWSTGNDGPASVNVDELFWLGNKLVAVTHGRGMYSILPTLGPPTLAPAGSVVSGGNNNGWVDPNECNRLNLPVQNIGGGVASNITAVLTTTTPGINILQGSSGYPDLTPNVIGTNTLPFQIYTDPSFVCGTPVSLMLTLSFSGTTNVLNFSAASASTAFAMTTSTGASFVSGTTDIGNHGDDTVTSLNLPFPFVFYGQAFSNATVSANGNLQFQSADNAFNNLCLPYSGFSYAILPFWDDLRTDTPGSGIFSTVAGTAPNRIFYLEWRATYFATGASVNFELALYENQPRFDVIYGDLGGSGTNATVGVEKDPKTYTSFECNSAAGVVSNGLQITFQQTCTDGGGFCPLPVASFTLGPTNGAVPLLVNFNNTSSGAVGYTWDFGDGHTSIAASPSNLFTNAGSYTVMLNAIGGGTTNSATNIVVVTNVPPSIAAPPQGLTVDQGSNALFSMTAAGTPPFSYQWRFGGVEILGATASNYTRMNVGCADAGAFDVVVTNAAGSITSSVASLTVIAPPAIDLQPTNETVNVGQPAMFDAGATNGCGDTLAYQWQFDGTNVASATSSFLALVSAQATDAGNYALVATTAAGSTTSAVATLTVIVPPVIATPPANAAVAQGTNATFTVMATGYQPFTYQWREGGQPVNGAQSSVYTRTNPQCADAGGFDVIVGNSAGSVTSSVAMLTVVAPPVVVTNPVDQTVVQGQGVTFLAAATNDCGGGLVYQWQFAGTNIDSATNSMFAITNVQPASTGAYAVAVTNLGGSVTSAPALLTVLVPPGVAALPASVTVGAGMDANFIVNASGSLPLSYQWREAGVTIGGAIASTYTRTNAQCANAGGFDVVVTNAAGSITSSVTVLIVEAPPSLLTQPAGETIAIGTTTTFSVDATNDCGGGLAYQWQLGGINLIGATNVMFVRTNAQFTDSGNYTVLVTNLGGSITSSAALLIVTNPPQLVVTPVSLNFGLIATGATAQGSFGVSNAGPLTLNGTAAIGAGPFALTSSNPSSLTVPAFSATNLLISFAPVSPGTFSSAVTFATDGGNSTNALLGESLNADPPILLLPAQLASEFVFNFLTDPGKAYVVQVNDTLDPSGWVSLSTNLGDGTLKSVTNSISGSTQQFFRLSVAPH